MTYILIGIIIILVIVIIALVIALKFLDSVLRMW